MPTGIQPPAVVHPDRLADGTGLHVVCAVSNPRRYWSRYELYAPFARHMRCSGAELWTAELAYGDRPFAVTDAADPRHLQLRGGHELWHKENLLNLAVQRLPADWKYVAWIDADVHFVRPDWAAETVQRLQHHPVVQLFAEAIDLGPDGLPLTRYRSFGWALANGVPRKKGPGYHGGTPPCRIPGIAYYHHPGFAWAMRRDAWDAVGGLFDVAVVGEADYIMCKAALGEAADTLYPGVAAGYRHAVSVWQDRARALQGDIGFVPGTLVHSWHGKKAARQYWDRCRILVESKFDPSVHLKRDWQGLWQFHDAGDGAYPVLRDRIRGYFGSRNEDGIDP